MTEGISMFKLALNNKQNNTKKRNCIICNVVKPYENFDIDQRRPGGITTRCRACRLEYQRKYRENNPDKVAKIQKRWSNDNIGKITASSRNWQKRNPEKRYAHNQVAIALKSGKLKRQDCVICGAKADAHHEDYTKPLDVIWFCKLHHARHHQKLRTDHACK